MRFWIILLCFSLQILKADTVTDSLQQLIGQSEGARKVELTLQLAGKVAVNSRRNAIPIYNRAVELAKTSNDKTIISAALYAAGENYYFAGNADSTTILMNECLQIAGEIGDSSRIGQCLLRIGNCYTLLNEQELAEQTYLEALAVIQSLDDPILSGRTLNNLANIYGRWGQYIKALSMYDRAREYFEESGFTEGLGWLNFSIARLYKQISDYENALKHSQQALHYYQQISEATEDSSGIMICYGQLGDIYIQIGDFKKAMEYHQTALQLRRKTGVKSAIADSYRGLGEIYYFQKDYDRAMDYFQKAIGLRRDIKTTLGIATLMKYVGLIYLEQGDTKKARNYLKGALSLAKKGKQKIIEKEVLEKMILIYLEWKDYENACRYFDRYVAISDSVLNFSVSNKISSYRVNNEILKQQKEKENLIREMRIAELELDQQKNTQTRLLILLIAALIVSLVIIFMYRQKSRANKTLVSKNMEIASAHRKLQAEIEERKRIEKEREELIVELKDSLSKIKTLSGLIPICANCKKIRNDNGYYEQLEKYIMSHSDAVFSHGICPDCMKKLYPDIKTDENFNSDPEEKPGS